MTRMQRLAVVVTCLLAGMTNAGAVTAIALVAFVLPGIAIAAIVGSVLAARRLLGTALLLGGLLSLGWAELVNVWSGTADGPAARATFVASGCTLVAVVVTQSRSPALFLVAVAGSVCSALLLGAGGEVRIVAVAAAVAASLTLGWIERSRRKWSGPPRGAWSLVILSLLAGGVAAGVVLVQVQRDSRPPEAIGSGRAYPGIKPPWPDPLGMARSPEAPPATPPSYNRPHPPHEPATKAPTVRATPAPHPAHRSPRTHPAPSRIWLYVLGGLVVVLLALVARLLAVRLAWRRLRRRLAAGAIADQVTGAWTWSRIRLEACRLPIPAAASPDIVAAGAAGIDLPGGVSAPLRMLATSTTSAAFANVPLADDVASVAWSAAHEAEASARELLTRRARVGLAFRGPALKTGR